MDSITIHNFLSIREAGRLGLSLVQLANYIKAMNFMIVTPIGLTKYVITKVRQWKDMLDFLVLQMDDFDVILGVDFTVHTKVGIFLHYNGLIIYGGE